MTALAVAAREGRSVPRPPVSTIDCVLGVFRHAPRDQMGHVISMSGRRLLSEAARGLYGLTPTGPNEGLTRDAARRWVWPEQHLHASVAHCGTVSVVVFAASSVGVDVQDQRDRPGALAWLGELLGKPAGCSATITEFAECEALIKASPLTKETFAGVRLPAWRPGWRSLQLPYAVRSSTLPDGMALAVVAANPLPLRWWMTGPDGQLHQLAEPFPRSTPEVLR